MAFWNAMIEIALISLAMSIVSQALQRKFVDKKAMKESQSKMKENQKKLKELMKKGDERSKAEADKLQKETLELMSKSMSSTTKHMMVSLPIFFVVFGFLGMAYSGSLVSLPFQVPVIHKDWSFEITRSISWLWWYIYSSLAISIALNLALKALEKKKVIA